MEIFPWLQILITVAVLAELIVNAVLIEFFRIKIEEKGEAGVGCNKPKFVSAAVCTFTTDWIYTDF